MGYCCLKKNFVSICGLKSSLSEIRISETLKATDPDLIQVDDFKNKQLLSLTINLLLFIRSQVPVTKKLFQSCEFTLNDR